MKVLTHDEMLAIPEAQGFPKKDNPTRLADYLVRRLCNKKLSDFEFGEAFKIEAHIATLTIDESGAKLESKHTSTEKLVEMFSKINAVQDKVKGLSERAKNIRTAGEFKGIRKFAESSMGLAKGGLQLAEEDVYNARIAVCKGCENWEDTAQGVFGRCKKCGATSARLRLSNTQCPRGKWQS